MSNHGGGSKFNDKQERAIAALLSEPTHQAAADKAGISLATLQRWLRRDNFREAYFEAREAVLQETIGRLIGVCGDAVKALADNLKAASSADQIRAANGILSQAFRGFSIYDKTLAEMKDRLDKLEELNKG